MEKKFRFTKSKLETIKPSGRRETYYDLASDNLMLMVYPPSPRNPEGVKTFFFLRKINGVTERIALGKFPSELTVDQARGKADLYRHGAKDGLNRVALKRKDRGEPTFAEVFEQFIHKKRNRAGKPLAESTVEDYRSLMVNHLRSIAKLKMSMVNADALRKLRIKSDAQNNRARALISSVFTWAQDEGISDAPNPAKAIKNRLIKSRERFLLPAEMPGFLNAVNESRLRDFFLLALLTGARRSNLQAMRWQDINFEDSHWRIPKTKNGDSQTIALVPEALDILVARKREAAVYAIWVFPGSGKSGHLVEPKKAWHDLLNAAELSEDLRIHDLRRTLGSWQARAGASLTVIGKSLGHRSQQATAIYSRLDLDPVRQSVQAATSAILDAGRAKTTTRLNKADDLS